MSTREYPTDDYMELKEVAEFDQIINERDVYRCGCGHAHISLSPPRYCPGCGEESFHV